jgi:hypothetical protein
MLTDERGLRYHVDIRLNNMTLCQEDLLYECLP